MSKYIDKDKVLEYIIFGVIGKDITCGELKRAIESFPTIEVNEKTGRDIHCPEDIGFENTFHDVGCKAEQFYNNCYHCWGSAIAKRCHQERQRDAEIVKSHINVIITENGIDKNEHTNEVLRNIIDEIMTHETV